MKRVTYAGIYLTKKPLEWFQLYLTKAQTNKITSTNSKIKYMFSTWEGFCNQLIQIYKNAKKEKRKKYNKKALQT